jgi:hypothetical protein
MDFSRGLFLAQSGRSYPNSYLILLEGLHRPGRVAEEHVLRSLDWAHRQGAL